MKRLMSLPIWIIIVLFALVFCSAGSIAYAYTVTKVDGEIVILEPLSLNETNFSISMYPDSVVDHYIELKNESDNPITIYPSATISPDPKQEICIEAQSSVVISAKSSINLHAQIMATNSAIPGTYQASFIFER